MDEGRGILPGAVEQNRGPLMTSGLVRLIGPCTLYRLGRHRIPLASAFLTARAFSHSDRVHCIADRRMRLSVSSGPENAG
jgi:hypothetical protein